MEIGAKWCSDALARAVYVSTNEFNRKLKIEQVQNAVERIEKAFPETFPAYKANYFAYEKSAAFGRKYDFVMLGGHGNQYGITFFPTLSNKGKLDINDVNLRGLKPHTIPTGVNTDAIICPVGWCAEASAHPWRFSETDMEKGRETKR